MNDEAKSFPCLFPEGKNDYDEKRDTVLTRGKYINARLFNADLRFAQNSGYIFYCQAVFELANLISGISVQTRKGTHRLNGQNITAGMLTDHDQLQKLCKSNLAFTHMQTLRGSPEYWKNCMNDLFAMIRQIGIPTFFVTFSSAELS